MKHESVTLTPAEVAFTVAIATLRDARKVDKTAFANKSSFTAHYVGAMGEVCFRKVYGGKIDQSVKSGGDNHAPDIILPDGRKVEIKTSTFWGKDVELKFEDDELNHFEYCCLIQVKLLDFARVYTILHKDDVIPNLIKKDYGYGARHVYKLDQ